jgi:thioredoxin 1
MNRRDFIILTAAATLAAPMARAAATAYAPEAVAAELGAGRTVVLNFTASWCSSCQSQGRKIEALRAANPSYDAAIAFFDVDWDTYGDTDLAAQYGVTSRGALVILRGDAVIAQTATHSTEEQLKALLDQAANAA